MYTGAATPDVVVSRVPFGLKTAVRRKLDERLLCGLSCHSMHPMKRLDSAQQPFVMLRFGERLLTLNAPRSCEGSLMSMVRIYLS